MAIGSECVECKKCGARGPWSQGTGEDGSQRKAALKLWGESGKPRYWEDKPDDLDVPPLRGERMRAATAMQDGIGAIAARVGMAAPPLLEATVLGIDLAADPGELPKTRLTTDQNDPRLTHGIDTTQAQQAEVYLVLSAEERAKGFVRPLRRSYVHTTCGAVTTMGLALCETYARDPKFYGATYCCNCGMHRPVSEFTWEPDGAVVGS